MTRKCKIILVKDHTPCHASLLTKDSFSQEGTDCILVQKDLKAAHLVSWSLYSPYVNLMGELRESPEEVRRLKIGLGLKLST